MTDLMVRSLFGAGHDHVILDATHVTVARRDRWRSVAWKTCCVVFDTPASICIERAGDNAELVNVINRMSKDWQEPDMTEDWVIAKSGSFSFRIGDVS
jgi:predicted kinase